MVDKIYPFNINPTDILIQNENGGGMLMNDQFVSIVSNMLSDEKKLLDGQNNTDAVNVQTNKFSSGIFITNGNNENPTSVNDLASNNFDSLSPANDNVVLPNQNIIPTPSISILTTPTPQPTPQTTPQPSPSPLTSEEIEEGLYEANFLPAQEAPGFTIYEFIDVTNNDNDIITFNDLTEINKIENQIRVKNGQPPVPPVKKTGTVVSLISNNDPTYGNLGDLYYYPTSLYNQNDSSWGSLNSGLKMSSHGCAYNTTCMLLGNATKDPNKCTPLNIWNNGNKSVMVYWDKMAATVNKKITLTQGSMAQIDKILQTKPVGFEWYGGIIYKNKGWDKGYNLYKGNVKVSPSGKKVTTKGISYTSSKQHWMVITGKNSDGTYTIFDPAGGVIRKNQTTEHIEAGLNRIIYIN